MKKKQAKRQMDPVTIGIIVMNVLNTILHGYHIKKCSCRLKKCGIFSSCAIDDAKQPKEEKSTT